MISLIKKNFWLILIVLISILLRTYKLSSYPEAIDEDEMSLGYISYSLLHSGTDEYNNKFPIYFKSVGDYKYGLYSYFAMLPISLFGLSEFSTRLMSSIFGVLSVIAIYYLGVEIFKNKKIGLVSALILCLNPTFIHFSRVAYNNVMGGFFATFSILLFIKVVKKFNYKKLFFWLLFYTLSIFSYQAYRVILPVIFVLIPVILLKKKEIKKGVVKLIILNLVSISLIVFSFLPKESRARAQGFSTLVNSASLTESFSEDNLAGSKLLTTRINHNKVQSFSLDYLKRYLTYFDPKFVFLETGGSERHSTPGVGLLYLIELPILILSIYLMSRRGKSKDLLIPIVLVLVAPLGASFVLDPSSTTRSLFLVYGYSLILGYGIYSIFSFKLFKRYKFITSLLLVGLYLFNFSYFYHNYVVHKVYHHPWNSDVGLKEMSLSIYEKYITKYDKVVVSKGHYIPFLFYGINNKNINFSLNDFANKTGVFSKLIFGMPVDCPSMGQKNVLYVCFGYKVPKAARLIEVFRYRDGQPAIILVDFNRSQEGALPDKVEWGEDGKNIKLGEKEYWPNSNNSR